MGTVKKIADAIKSIPGKKESLRESLEVLKSYSSSLATFTLDWKDLDNHLSAIEKSIDERFKALEAKEEEKRLLSDKSNNTSTASKNDKFAIFRKGGEEEVEEMSPRPELESICVRMDGKGLAAFMEKMRSEDINVLRKELAPALRLASDPAQLVLDFLGFHANSLNSKLGSGSDYLLEKLQLVAPEISPAVREKALKQAAEWKTKISFDRGGNHSSEVVSFLQLIASFDIVDKFDHEEILELFSTVSRRKQALVLVKNLGLTDNLPEIIQKLSSKGRYLDAVKIISAYDMADKFPPVPLLEAYVKESKRIAQEVLKTGKNPMQFLNEAIAREIGALKSVVKAIEDYKLESEYPCQDLKKRISELEQQKASRKRDAACASVSISKNQHQQRRQQQQQQQQRSNKRSRQLATPPVHPMHTNMTGPYGWAAPGSVYSHVDPSLSGTMIGHSGAHSPPRPYFYSSEAFAGPTGQYDRPMTYTGYPPSGLPPAYGSSVYP